MMTKKMGLAQPEIGFKIMVFEVREIIPEKKYNLPIHLRNNPKNRYAFKPLRSKYLEFNEINTPQKFAKAIYDNFGASEKGITYNILYFFKKTAYIRRFKKLCRIKLYDLPNGKFKADFIDMRNIKRFNWFNSEEQR